MARESLGVSAPETSDRSAKVPPWLIQVLFRSFPLKDSPSSKICPLWNETYAELFTSWLRVMPSSGATSSEDATTWRQ